MRNAVNVDEKVITLQRYATEIRTLKSQTADALIRIGKRLMDAQRVLKELPRAERNRRWAAFLIEADLSEQTAKRFARIAEAFGDNIPDLPVGRLDTIVKTLAKPEERRAFVEGHNLATMPPQHFEETLQRYKSRAEAAEKRLVAVEKAVSDTPVKVIEANVSLRRLDMALATSIEALTDAGTRSLIGNIEGNVVRSVKQRIEVWFSLVAEAENFESA